jgi:hypothetical protein
MSVSNQDFQIEEAISEGKRLADDGEPEEIILKFTETQVKMIQDLIVALGVSVRSLLDYAINYVYYQRNNQEIINTIIELSQLDNREFNHQIQGKGNKHNKNEKKIILTAEITYKLEELGMKEKIYECVVTGITLLYERLISMRQKTL